MKKKKAKKWIYIGTMISIVAACIVPAKIAENSIKSMTFDK